MASSMRGVSTKAMAMITVTVLVAFISTYTCVADETARYEPNWESLDSRPLPSWYDEAKVGIFIHWGVFSVPSFRHVWFWYWWKGPNPEPQIIKFMEDNYRPDWTYADFAKDFTVQTGVFNPLHWADIFNASGARYVVQVTKHHEGFTSWPSKHSFNWNSMDVGPHRDLVGEIANAVRLYPNLRYGVYHSLYEWFHPLFLKDRDNNYTTQDFVRYKTMPELYELVNNYKPDIVWSDGCPSTSRYWNSTNFLAWLYNDSPVKDTVVTNDRWGGDAICRHGGYLTCSDRYNPGILQKKKFENAMTLDKTWGWRRESVLADCETIENLVKTLVMTVSCNGNILINVPPTKDGTIAAIYEERLRQLGSWLGVNGEAIYKSRPWTYQNDTMNSHVWYTTKGSGRTKTVYAISLVWPDDELTLGAPQAGPDTTVSLLGYHGDPQHLPYNAVGQGVVIKIPTISYNKMPCYWAWVFKLTNVLN